MCNKFTSFKEFTSAVFYEAWDVVIKAWLECGDSFDAQKNPLNVLNDGTLSLQHLPEPYYGDMDNPSIVIINLNPGTGLCEQCHLRKDVPGILVNDVKNVPDSPYSQMAKVFPLYGKSPNVHMPQESINWWKSRLKWIDHILEIRKDMGISIDGNKKPFAIELVPLHSKSFKVSKAAEYVKNKYPAVLGAIEYAITKSDAKMGLAIGKPIYDTLKQFGYTGIDITLAQNAQQPNTNIKSIKRDYSVLENKNNGLKILCTWSSGSNKAPAKDPFWGHEENIIKKYFK